MRTERTDEEIKQNHIECLGKDLGSLYHELWDEVGWLLTK